MAYQNFKRVPAQRFKAPASRHQPFVAPTRGWVSGANLAAAPAGSALVLENFYPTSTGIRMRGGSQKHATVGEEPIESAFAYVGLTRKMFGASDGEIFELTSVADPDVPPADDVTGQTSDYYSTINFATSGGHYLLAANGTDDIQLFDGTTWSAIESGADPGEIDSVASNTISQLYVYRNRVWMVQDGTTDAWYLPIDSIAGDANRVALAGVFRKGGALLFIASWSQDSGAGFDDRIVFVSTEGEVAVFSGDPALTDWGLVGRYDAAPPMGKNAFETFGGDLVIVTTLGLLPLSAITTKDPATLSLAALSRNIQPDWVTDALTRRSLPWEIVKWTSRNIAYISCPVTSDQVEPWCYALNLETGAWAKVTGWNTRCLVVHDDWVYFGTNDGTLMQADVTGADDGALIAHLYVGQFDHLGEVGRFKTVRQARATFKVQHVFRPLLSVATDYDYSSRLPAYPSAEAVSGSLGVWDVGLWDQALWDVGTSLYTSKTRWTSVGASGEVHAPVVQITSGGDIAPGAELVLFEVKYEPGNYDG